MNVKITDTHFNENGNGRKHILDALSTIEKFEMTMLKRGWLVSASGLDTIVLTKENRVVHLIAVENDKVIVSGATPFDIGFARVGKSLVTYDFIVQSKLVPVEDRFVRGIEVSRFKTN